MKPVIQMRVEPEEKARLLAEAKAEGISLSDLLRHRCLRDSAHRAQPVVTRTAEAPRVAPEPLSSDFRQRVNHFKYSEGMTTKRAEAAAREEAA